MNNRIVIALMMSVLLSGYWLETRAAERSTMVGTHATTASRNVRSTAEHINYAQVPGREAPTTPWRRFQAEVSTSLRESFARLLEIVAAAIPRLLAALLVILLFGILAHVVRWLGRSLVPRVVKDLTVENLFKQLAYYSVWAIGLIVAAGALGFDPQTVVTGLGFK
jgi:hypothetical protein